MKQQLKELPILFQGDMVRAILDGRKTQTRRIMKPQEPCDHWTRSPNWPEPGECWLPVSPSGKVGIFSKRFHRCPYGARGDVLWVREKHVIWFPTAPNGEPQGDGWKAKYAADGSERWTGCQWDEGPQYLSPEDAGVNFEPILWRPSIFMPRWACRLQLRVEAIRVERVQDITEADARAEGVQQMDECRGSWSYAFAHLWNSINGKPKPVESDGIITHYVSCPWEAITETREHRGLPWYVTGNPFVWVVEFERISE